MAAALLGSVNALRDEAVVSRSPVLQKEHDAQMTQLRENLDEAALEVAWARGEQLSWEEVIEEAISMLEAS